MRHKLQASGSAPQVQGLVEDALAEPPDGLHHEIPFLCVGTMQHARES